MNRSASQVMVLLATVREFHPGRASDTSTRHITVADSGSRFSTYAIGRDVLLPHLGAGGDDTGARPVPIELDLGLAGRQVLMRAAAAIAQHLCLARHRRAVLGRLERPKQSIELAGAAAAAATGRSAARRRRSPWSAPEMARPVASRCWRLPPRMRCPAGNRIRGRLKRNAHDHRLVQWHRDAPVMTLSARQVEKASRDQRGAALLGAMSHSRSATSAQGPSTLTSSWARPCRAARRARSRARCPSTARRRRPGADQARSPRGCRRRTTRRRRHPCGSGRPRRLRLIAAAADPPAPTSASDSGPE